MKKNEDWIEKITKYKLWLEVKLKKKTKTLMKELGKEIINKKIRIKSQTITHDKL